MSLYQDAGRYAMSNTSAKPPTSARSGVQAAQAQARDKKTRRSRRNLILLVLVGIIVVAAVLVAADLQRANTSLSIEVGGQQVGSVDLNQSLPLSPYLLGSNVFPRSGTIARDPTGRGFMSYDPPIVSGLRSAGVKLLRFPGGNWGEQHTPSKVQLDDFSTLLNQVGADGMMQAQLSDPLDATPVSLSLRATRAALLVDYMNNKQSIQRSANAPFHAVRYWTIGNEPDLLTNPDTRQKYTVKDYTNAFITYSLAMHQKDPNIQIFGPELSQYSATRDPKDSTGEPWMQGFLTRIANYEHTHSLPFHILDGVSFHIYPFGSGQSNVNTLVSNAQEWDTLVPFLRQLIRQTFDQDLPVAVTEINTNPNRGSPAQNLAALWWAETLGKLMSNQVEFVAFFATEGIDSPTPLFEQSGLTQTSLLRTMQLFAKLQKNLVPIQNLQGPVSLYATQDDGHNNVSLFFVNTTNTVQNISVQAASFLPVNILPVSPWQSANLTVQGFGMVILTLHRSGNNEAFSFDNAAN